MPSDSKPPQTDNKDFDNQTGDTNPNECSIPQSVDDAENSDDEKVHAVLEISFPNHGAGKWIDTNIKKGSTIELNKTCLFNYWVWERSFSDDSPEPRWSIRPLSKPNLYVTYDDSGNLTMETKGKNIYFTIEVGHKAGYFIRVLKSGKYIGFVHGKLVLTESATEWNVLLRKEKLGIKLIRADILSIIDRTTGEKWISGLSKPGAFVTVAIDESNSPKLKWISRINVNNYTRTFSPMENGNLYVICNLDNNIIMLEKMENSEEHARHIPYRGREEVVFLSFDKNKYFCSIEPAEGGIKILELTDRELDAVKWRYTFYNFWVEECSDAPGINNSPECKESFQADNILPSDDRSESENMRSNSYSAQTNEVGSAGNASLPANVKKSGEIANPVLEIFLENAGKWIDTDLAKGSTIQVAKSQTCRANYWVWEKNFIDDSSEPRWSIRPFSKPDLYVTYDDSGNLTMEPKGKNMYFTISVGQEGGYIVGVSDMNKFIGVKDGKLVLEESMTKWNVVLKQEREDDLFTRADILTVSDLSGNKWISGMPKPGAFVAVAADNSDSPKAEWISAIDAESYTRTFSPKEDPSLFVICNPKKENEVILEYMQDTDSNANKISYQGLNKVVLLNSDQTKYFYTVTAATGGVAVLALTDRELDATTWRYTFNGFWEIDKKEKCSGSKNMLGNSYLNQANDVGSAGNASLPAYVNKNGEIVNPVLEILLENDGKWIDTDLKEGSTIQVAKSQSCNYWVWEKSFIDDSSEPRWSVRPLSKPNLFVTYDDSGNLTMETKGKNMYFTISVGQDGGYIIGVSDLNKFIGLRDGILVLVDSMTKWNVILEQEREDVKFTRADILTVSDVLTGNKWVSKLSRPGAFVVVASDDSKSPKTKWISTIDVTSYTRTFSPKEDTRLFVICNPNKENEVILEYMENTEPNANKISYKGLNRVVLMNSDQTKYFCANSAAIDGVTVLKLTDRESDATTWRYNFYGFWEIDQEEKCFAQLTTGNQAPKYKEDMQAVEG